MSIKQGTARSNEMELEMGKFKLADGLLVLDREGKLTNVEINPDVPRYPYKTPKQEERTFTPSGWYDDCGEQDPYDLIETLSHRLHRILCSTTVPGLLATEDGQPYPLIDLLSDGETIDGGFARLQSITEQILAGLFLEWEESKAKHPWPEGLEPVDWSDE